MEARGSDVGHDREGARRLCTWQGNATLMHLIHDGVEASLTRAKVGRLWTLQEVNAEGLRRP